MNKRDLLMTVNNAEKMIIAIAKGDIDVPEITIILRKAIK
jgi:hypothetical protein